MIQSATDRRTRTLSAITRSALRLADEYGFDGFTMDELAEEVGVSRRTLFNYVPSKMDAVLGPEKTPDPELFTTFVAGGPTGRLITDLRALAITVLSASGGQRADYERFRRLVRSDPRVMKATHDRFEAAIGHLVDVIRAREGRSFDRRRAQLAVKVIVVACDAALDAYLNRPQISFTDHVEDALDTLTGLFR